MSVTYYVADLEENIKLALVEFKGEPRVDIRMYEDDKPTIKGVSLPLDSWTQLSTMRPVVDEFIGDLKAGRLSSVEKELGNNFYINLNSPYWIIDLRRKYTTEDGQSFFTKRGVRLHLKGWNELMKLSSKVTEIFNIDC